MLTRHPRLLAVAVLWALAVAVSTGQGALTTTSFRNHPAIAYDKTSAHDVVAELSHRIQTGEVKLEYEPVRGYLKSVLKALNVPVESQMLVFSKTSFQGPRISPTNPRAIYFNDRVSIGFVRGGDVLEFLAQDPTQGSTFYTLDNSPTGNFEFKRNNVACILCHTSDATENVPGPFIGSVYPEKDGTTAYGPATTTDHRSPFETRWGGWYVLGSHHGDRHLGNAVALDRSDLASMVTPESVHLRNLEGRFDLTGYLTPYSDIVALLVIEHQAHMTNLITRIGWEARIGAEVGRALPQTAAELVDYMLFVDEAALPGLISGPSGFAKLFAAVGPRDSKGRSLRDLDLKARLMKYPCSYMIYSEQFNALPVAAKDAIYARMWEILSGQDKSARYAVLTRADRQAIVDILDETKPDLCLSTSGRRRSTRRGITDAARTPNFQLPSVVVISNGVSTSGGPRPCHYLPTILAESRSFSSQMYSSSSVSG